MCHCYAETFAERWRGIAGHPYEQGFDLRLWPERLEQPLRWTRPRMIFVNSMSDLFHEGIPASTSRPSSTSWSAPQQHTFQVLTKRHERLAELAPGLPWPANVWMGVTIENRRFVHRADHLRNVPAAVRFISAEPLLGPLEGLDLTESTGSSPAAKAGRGTGRQIEWLRELRDRCHEEDVAYFFKQWGGTRPKPVGANSTGAPGTSCRTLGAPGRVTRFGTSRMRPRRRSRSVGDLPWRTRRHSAFSPATYFRGLS